ncbi:MAG: hypothetical protein D6698_04040 [Gammaproteobacteria bacterium]|nr:MAG: hypothetical protein D6698_04040 [Gammaproteobacteria bacterium]
MDSLIDMEAILRNVQAEKINLKVGLNEIATLVEVNLTEELDRRQKAASEKLKHLREDLEDLLNKEAKRVSRAEGPYKQIAQLMSAFGVSKAPVSVALSCGSLYISVSLGRDLCSECNPFVIKAKRAKGAPKSSNLCIEIGVPIPKEIVAVEEQIRKIEEEMRRIHEERMGLPSKIKRAKAEIVARAIDSGSVKKSLFSKSRKK